METLRRRRARKRRKDRRRKTLFSMECHFFAVFIVLSSNTILTNSLHGIHLIGVFLVDLFVKRHPTTKITNTQKHLPTNTTNRSIRFSHCEKSVHNGTHTLTHHEHNEVISLLSLFSQTHTTALQHKRARAIPMKRAASFGTLCDPNSTLSLSLIA